MEDFSNDLFSSFFDDPVLDEKSPPDMELDSPTPGIQAEHSYSLRGDSRPEPCRAHQDRKTHHPR